jgi:ABC-type transport system substrate-binding protein
MQKSTSSILALTALLMISSTAMAASTPPAPMTAADQTVAVAEENCATSTSDPSVVAMTSGVAMSLPDDLGLHAEEVPFGGEEPDVPDDNGIVMSETKPKG